VPHLAEAARQLIDSDTPLGITPVALLEAAHVLSNPPYSVRGQGVHPLAGVPESAVRVLQG
jgi:hypothetical protein